MSTPTKKSIITNMELQGYKIHTLVLSYRACEDDSKVYRLMFRYPKQISSYLWSYYGTLTSIYNKFCKTKISDKEISELLKTKEKAGK